MDFVVGVPKTRRYNDSIFVIVNRMTKSAHFIPVKSTYWAEDYARLYIDDIMRLHFLIFRIEELNSLRISIDPSRISKAYR